MPQKIKLIIKIFLSLIVIWQVHLTALGYSGNYQILFGFKPKYFQDTKILIPKDWSLLTYSDDDGIYTLSYWHFGFRKYKNNEVPNKTLKMMRSYVFRDQYTKFSILVINPNIDSTVFEKIENQANLESLFSIMVKKQLSTFFMDNEVDKFETPLGEAINIKNRNFIVIPDHFLALRSTNKNEKIIFFKDKLKELKIESK